MKRRYVWDRKSRRWVEFTPNLSVMSPQITPDIQPYRSAVTGEMITGRRQHREHLKRHGCEEVGNESLNLTTPQHNPSKSEIVDSIREAQRQVEWGESPTLERLREESPRYIRELGLD